MPFALLLLCLVQFHSWISIELGPSSDAKNPFATPFYLVNQGNLPVLDLAADCEYRMLSGDRIGRVSKVSERLTFKQRQVLPCAAILAEDLQASGSISFTVIVHYRVAWLPWHRSQIFRLRSVPLANGAYLWIQEN